MKSITPRSKAILTATVLDNPYIPLNPSAKQAEFLVDDRREILYGGAAGGGKSVGLLIAALMYVTEPGYTALLLRRTYKDLALPEAIMDLADQWLHSTDAKWNNETKTWTFPSGATLTFGYLETEKDKYRYQGAKFNFVGFDELTQFTESQYTYLFSRIRRPIGSTIPGRMRASSNPGGIGHQWVKERFISNPVNGRLFIPAGLVDNPYLDQDEYRKTLSELDPVTRAQLEDGNWDISAKGEMFQRDWFEIVDQAPACARIVRFYDKAATEPTSKNPDPDYTAGLKLGYDGKHYYIIDLVHFRKNPGDTDVTIEHTKNMDGVTVSQRMEEEPGSSGKSIIDTYTRTIFRGCDFRGVKSTGSKIARAKPVSSAAYNRLIKVVRAPWNSTLFWELEMFPQEGAHDDIVDALSGAYNELSLQRPTTIPRFGSGVAATGGMRI